MSAPKRGKNTYGSKRRWDYKLGGWVEGNFWGAPQGYYGHTIGLFLALNVSKQMITSMTETRLREMKGIRSSALHFRSEAEKELRSKMKTLMFKVPHHPAEYTQWPLSARNDPQFDVIKDQMKDTLNEIVL